MKKLIRTSSKYLLYILILSLFPAVIFAQNVPNANTLKGKVQDSATGQPVNAAIIYVVNTKTATSTDEQGVFSLKAKEPIKHITVECAGYVSKVIDIDNPVSDLLIMLAPVVTTLKSVEVIGVKTPQAVNTLTAADLNRASGLNLQDALNNLPGVNMQSRTPWGGQHIIIRGYYPSVDNGRSNGENFGGLGYQLYINNIPVTDATGTSVMDDIDYSTLGKVEVTKGPSPLYGSYIGGAVNMFTPTIAPNETSIREQSIVGSYGLFRTNTSIATSNGKSDLWINYGHQKYDGFRPHDSSNKDFLSIAANFHVNSKETISTYFSYSHSYEQLAGEIDSAAFYGRQAVSDNNYVVNDSHATIESFRGGVTDKRQFDQHFGNQTTLFVTGSTLDGAFAHGYTRNESLNFGGKTELTYESKHDDLNVNGELGASFIKSNQNAQGNFILPFVSPPFTPTTGFLSATDVQNNAMNYNIFTQWKFTMPAQQLSLTAGASLNFVQFGTQNLIDSLKAIFLKAPVLTKTFTPVFTPNISLLKVFNNNISVYANVALGYTPPTISQMTNSAGVVDATLKPERAVQYEIGTKGTLGDVQQFSYQAALFDLDITNRLTQITANSISYYTNIGEQRNLGAELYASYSFINDKKSEVSLLRPWVSYTFLDAKYVDFKSYAASGTGSKVVADYSNNKVAAVSPNVLNAGIDAATKIGFYFSASYQYVDKVPVTFDNSTYMKSYNLLRARIGYKQSFGTHFTADIFAGGDNLLGKTYYSFLFVGQNIQELAQGNDTFVKGGGGDGYILPAPYKATFYGGLNLSYRF